MTDQIDTSPEAVAALRDPRQGDRFEKDAKNDRA